MSGADEEDMPKEERTATCIERCCALSIFIISIWSFIATFAGIVIAYVYKPALMVVAQQIGTGAENLIIVGDVADILLITVLAVNAVALIPIVLSQQDCQKRCFGSVSEGCCGGCVACMKALLGLWLTRVIELLLFLSMVLMTGVSYVFVGGYTMAEFLKSICDTGASAIEPAMLLIDQLATANATSHYSFLKDLDLDTYCAAGSAGEEDNMPTLMLILGCMITVLAQPLTLALIARAKESIRNEISDAKERSRRSLTAGRNGYEDDDGEVM